MVIIDRQEGASKRLSKLGITLHSLFKISDILESLVKSDILKENEKKMILDYMVKNIEK